MKPSSKARIPTAGRAPTRTRYVSVCWIALSLVALLNPSRSAAVNDAYLPYIEPLQVAQQRAYVAAAPRGQDEEPPSPATPVAVTVSGPVEPEESRLEQLAGQKKGPLSLAESQQKQVLHSDLAQFGYDIFHQVPGTFAPVAGIPVPPNYQIGPGDNIVVQLFGKRNVEYKLIVTRDGNILVPEYGPVKVAGLTFDEAELLITQGFERRVIGTRAVVTMGQLRTIQIRLAGDVVRPGVYTVGGLTTTIDALLASGGVRPTGSLRNIQLIRNGKRIARLDLYDLLLRGHSDKDIYLAHNDTIFVPPLGPVVYVGGEVQRPAIYELDGEQRVGQVLAMAGGLLPTASLEHSHIERIQSAGSRTLIDFSTTRAGGDDAVILGTAIRNGDLLRILALADELDNVVMLSGHVKRPGGYQFRQGMRVSDLLPGVEMLMPGADVDFLLIKREQPATLRTEILYVNLLEAVTNPGTAADIPLRTRDQVIVFNRARSREQTLANAVRELDVQGTDYRPARVVEVRGAARHTGRLPLQEDARLLDVVALAGGLQPGAELFYGIIARTAFPSRAVDMLAFNLAAAMGNPEAAANLSIAPGDRVYVFDDRGDRSALLQSEIERLRRQASYGSDEALVTIQGEVLQPGIYPLARNMRASDLLCAARGLTRKADGLGAELSRVQHGVEAANRVQHTGLDSASLLTLCDLGRWSAAGQVIAAGDQDWHTRYLNDQRNPLLEPGDQLTFTEKSGWVEQATVTLHGEVTHPGVYAIDRGETLCQVVKRAGGVTGQAYTFGAVFSRESVRAMQQRTLDELQDQLDDLMVELSLSHSFNNADKSSPVWAGKQDYLKAIRQLERAEANGRLVIDLQKEMKCRGRNKLALEDGDSLTIPRLPNFVQVSGQVYVPTSHLFSEDRRIADYVELSGGATTLGRLKDTYVIQANGEALNYKGSRTSSRIARKSVMPGARIYVPLDVDRMNGTEKAQSWVSSLMQSAILAGILL